MKYLNLESMCTIVLIRRNNRKQRNLRRELEKEQIEKDVANYEKHVYNLIGNLFQF